MTSSSGNIFRVTGHLCGEFAAQRRGALMFSLICTRINGWVNNREAGDLRRNRAHYDVTVMIRWISNFAGNVKVDNCILITPRYNDVTMSAMASQITRLTIVYSTVYSRRRSKKTPMLRVTGLYWGNSPATSGFPSQRASIAENTSIWWRHHVLVFHICCNMYIMLVISSWYYRERHFLWLSHYSDVMMSAMASQITCVSIVYSTVGLDTDQRKHQSSASQVFGRGIHL